MSTRLLSIPHSVVDGCLGRRHSETMLTSCFSSNSHPLISESIGGSCWKNRHSNILMVIFYFLSALMKWNSSMKKNFLLLLIHLFLQLFSYIPKDSKILFYSLSYILICQHLSCCSHCSSFGLGEFFQNGSYALSHTNSFFQELDVTSWHHRKSRAHLLLALPQPWSQSLFQSARVSLENAHLVSWGFQGHRVAWHLFADKSLDSRFQYVPGGLRASQS